MSNNYTHRDCVEAITSLLLSENEAKIVFKHGDNTTRYILNSFIKVDTKEETLFTRLNIWQECLPLNGIEFYKEKFKHLLVTILVAKDATADTVVADYGVSRTSELIIVTTSDIIRYIKTKRKKGEDIFIGAKWVSGKCTDSEGRILFPPIPRKSSTTTNMREIAFRQNTSRKRGRIQYNKYRNGKKKFQNWRRRSGRKFSDFIPLK